MRQSPTRHRVALALALAGAALSAFTLVVHQRVETDAAYTSFCNLGGVVNCDVVLSSRWGRLFGVPVAGSRDELTKSSLPSRGSSVPSGRMTPTRRVLPGRMRSRERGSCRGIAQQEAPALEQQPPLHVPRQPDKQGDRSNQRDPPGQERCSAMSLARPAQHRTHRRVASARWTSTAIGART